MGGYSTLHLDINSSKDQPFHCCSAGCFLSIFNYFLFHSLTIADLFSSAGIVHSHIFWNQRVHDLDYMCNSDKNLIKK